MIRLTITCFVLGLASIAAAGPIRNLVHRATHPLETLRQNREARHASPQSAPAVESQAIPQQLPVGPAVDPLADKNASPTSKTPTGAESKIFLKHGVNPPAAPAGKHWIKLGCTPAGCEYQLLKISTRGSNFIESCVGCECGCLEGRPCVCGLK